MGLPSPRPGEGDTRPVRNRGWCRMHRAAPAHAVAERSAVLGCGLPGWCPGQRTERGPMMSAQTAEAPPRGTQRYQLDSGVGRLTPAERVARGKTARAEVPRESHAVFDPPPDRPDPA